MTLPKVRRVTSGRTQIYRLSLLHLTTIKMSVREGGLRKKNYHTNPFQWIKLIIVNTKLRIIKKAINEIIKTELKVHNGKTQNHPISSYFPFSFWNRFSVLIILSVKWWEWGWVGSSSWGVAVRLCFRNLTSFWWSELTMILSSSPLRKSPGGSPYL